MLIFSCGCASRPGPAAPKPSAPSLLAGEEEIGEKIHRQILSQFYPYTDPRVVEYVNRVGNSLAQFAVRREIRCRFTILYSDKIYATSSPGGFIYITTGMLYFLDNEAQLAAVLAHEIGRLQDKDPQLSKSRKVLEAVTRGGAMVGPAFGEIGVLAVLGLAMVNALAESRQISPSRKLIAADSRAFHYMIQADYDPQGLVELIQKFLRADRSVTPYFLDYYRSRPITEERAVTLQSTFAELPLQGTTLVTRQKEYREITLPIREMYRQ